nr:hypothetical protein [Tanacetum cinerariifolium]
MESSSSCTEERDLQQMQDEGNKLHSKCIAQFKYLETHLRLLNSYRYVDHFNSVIHIYVHEWKHNQFRDMMHKNNNQLENAVVQKDKSITSLQALRTQFELFFKSPNVTCTTYSPLHKDFKESTHYKPVKYRSRLLHYLDELEKLLKERTLKDGELRLKEKEVKAIKDIEKWLKDKEKQTQESMSCIQFWFLKGLGFVDHNDAVNPDLLDKAKELVQNLYNADKIRIDFPSDHKIISKEKLKCENEKRLNVKRYKSPLSYHGFVYGETQFVEPPEVQLKRRNINLTNPLAPLEQP